MITVVIPALNEQDSIHATVTQIHNVLDSAGLLPCEVIVVDDGSTDKTGLIAKEAGARVIHNPHNIGYGYSLKTGIRKAKFDMIAISDADGTYPIQDLPLLVRRYREGFDMVVGARSGKYYQESLLKMPLRWALRRLVEFTAARDIPDINSGLRVFSRQTAMLYYDHLCDTFSFTTSLTLAYVMTKRFVDYVPIDYNKRIGKTKVKLLQDSLLTGQYILEAAIYYNPLRIFLLMSMILLLCSFANFFLALILHLNIFYFFGIGSLFIALIIFALGLLATLLRLIMLKSQNKIYENNTNSNSHEEINK